MFWPILDLCITPHSTPLYSYLVIVLLYKLFLLLSLIFCLVFRYVSFLFQIIHEFNQSLFLQSWTFCEVDMLLTSKTSHPNHKSASRLHHPSIHNISVWFGSLRWNWSFVFNTTIGFMIYVFIHYHPPHPVIWSIPF